MSKRISQDISGDGPNTKRRSSSMEANRNPEFQRKLKDRLNEHTEPAESLDRDCNGDGQTIEMRVALSPTNHVPAYTGNGPICNVPSLESFMFQQTPAGSQLTSWVNVSESLTSYNEVNTLHLPEYTNGAMLRKQISTTSKLSRRGQLQLLRQNALKALALERELTSNSSSSSANQSVALMIRFPDPEITASMVAGYCKEITDVCLNTGNGGNVQPRSCLVYLKSGADVGKAIEELNQIRFGSGHLQAELRAFTDEEQAELIDPCWLYVSNIPFTMTTGAIKEFFVNSVRVDIGIQKRLKRARYAFVRYASPEIARDAFRQLVDSQLNSRILTVRYRRKLKRSTAPILHQTVEQSNNSEMTLNATDDDVKVLTPPPVESITISDDNEDNDNSEQSKLTKHDKDIRELKKQLEVQAKLIRDLQTSHQPKYKSECPDHRYVSKIEMDQTPIVDLAQNIKIERSYLGIHEPNESNVDTIVMPIYVPTTQPLDNSLQLDDPQLGGNTNKFFNCFGRLFSGVARRKSQTTVGTHTEDNRGGVPAPAPALQSNEARLEELYAQL
ncbi:protein painting of fourth isoform X1 [Drosophila tropicalis]|uniref:protein painting of fourth isoform X1 n=1 Tax=Drosophila tropicalis TaxID=46794 RepID=UPI0035ABC839